MNCKLCNAETDVVFKIGRRKHVICKKCASSIFLTQAEAFAKGEDIFKVQERKTGHQKAQHREVTSKVLNYLQRELLGEDVEYTPENVPEGYLNMISARINQGYKEKELMAVAFLKHKEWRGTDSEQYIRPTTLYRPRNFVRYLSEVQEKLPDWSAKFMSTKDQRAIMKKLNGFGIRNICNEETDALAKELMGLGYDNKEFLNLYLIEKI